MSDNNSPFEEYSRETMSREVRNQMLKGAAFAAAVVIVPIAFIYAIYLVSLLLPPESKEAFDPSYGSVIEERTPLESVSHQV